MALSRGGRRPAAVDDGERGGERPVGGGHDGGVRGAGLDPDEDLGAWLDLGGIEANVEPGEATHLGDVRLRES